MSLASKKRKHLKESAKRRGIRFNLSWQEVEEFLLVKNCGYCSVELNFTTNHPNCHSFDRIIAFRGYEEGNIIISCKKCNDRKSACEFEFTRLYLDYNKQVEKDNEY